MEPKQTINSRIIGTYSAGKKGALVVAIGAMHGNEPAGVLALQEVFKMLENESKANPQFVFKGKFVGLIGHLNAFRQRKRFIDKDLNRLWTAENLTDINRQRIDNFSKVVNSGMGNFEETKMPAEFDEMSEIIHTLKEIIRAEKPETLILLDLHTTSAQGGIFSIPTLNETSLKLAKSLKVPVILGLMDGVEGTLLHFSTTDFLKQEGFPKQIVGVAFEGGQHDEPLSVSRSISAIINCLRAVGCVEKKDVDNRHDEILRKYSENLPKVARIRFVHHIEPDSEFKMRPGFQNFQAIKKGELLAKDKNGDICAPIDGLILMPLYQPLGSDGFFIVEELG